MTGYNEADEGSGDSGVMPAAGPSRDVVKKLDQIIQVSFMSGPSRWNGLLMLLKQNFHTKAAYLILQARMPLPIVISKDGTKKVNKWVCKAS